MDKFKVKNIIDKIKKDHIAPESRFQLRWKSYVFWLTWGIVMLFGAFSFSLLIFNILDVRPEYFHYLGIGRFMKIMFLTAPYLWLSVSIIAFVSGFIAIRKTHHGYRYNILFITSMSVMIIALLGVVMHMAKFNDHMMDGPIPHGLAFPARERWHNPEEGLLGGQVVNISDSDIVLLSFENTEWHIQLQEDTRIYLPRDLEKGMMIEVVGEKKDDSVFSAKFIRPFPERFRKMQNLRNAIDDEKIVPHISE